MPELDAGRPTEEYREPGHVTVIDCGTRDGYYTRKLTMILELIELAEKHGGIIVWS